MIFPNGAGKTTASYTVLPEIWYCKEFVNADNIAAGISPFNAESVALEAGRIMLKRIRELMEEKADFAFETTLATRSYVSLIKEARERGYEVTLVAKRVSHGGHHIPDEVVIRRYYRGLQNLIHLYISYCDKWFVLDNMDLKPEIIAKNDEFGEMIINNEIWSIIQQQNDGNE